MIEKEVAKNIKLRKETVKVEIKNFSHPPIVVFYRRYTEFDENLPKHSETKTFEIPFENMASDIQEINGKIISAMDVFLFIRNKGDLIDSF